MVLYTHVANLFAKYYGLVQTSAPLSHIFMGWVHTYIFLKKKNNKLHAN